MSVKVIDTVATSRNIRRILEEQNIKPKEVQKALDLESVQAIYKWISPRCKTIPSLDSLVQLSNFLECDMEEILVMTEIDE